MIFEIDKKQVFASTAGKDFDPTKKTVFLLHGSGLSHIVWSLTEQFLSNKDLNILSLDLPGHGNSDGPCIDSIEKIADWIESVRLFLKTEQVSIVGHSHENVLLLKLVQFLKKVLRFQSNLQFFRLSQCRARPNFHDLANPKIKYLDLC